jgi:hypothetical protein
VPPPDLALAEVVEQPAARAARETAATAAGRARLARSASMTTSLLQKELLRTSQVF